jgi:hypothetical protein
MGNSVVQQCERLSRHASRRFVIAALAAVPMLGMVACATTSPAPTPSAPEVVGTVALNQGPPTDVLMGGGGTGTVFFKGRLYGFTIGGRGVEGDNIAILRTSGRVYRLVDIARFAGIYRRAPGGAVVPGQPADGLWLQNEHAAVLHLDVPPGGRMPNIGTDGVGIVLNEWVPPG